LYDAILDFVQKPTDEKTFERLALEAFAFQYEQIAPYKTLCDRRGAAPGSVDSWREVPPVPVLAYSSVELASAEPKEVFRSSGTTDGARSTHHHPFPDLYRAVIDATFAVHCLPQAGRIETLSLIPTREDVVDSSLGFMAEHILQRHGGGQSTTAFGPRGVDGRALRSWLSARQRTGAPILILTTSFALVQMLDALGRLGLRFRLPAGSVLFDTGGTKGKTEEVSRDELVSRVGQELGLPPSRIVREYGMTELTSHFYTRALTGGDRDLFYPSPWTRVRVLDPETLQELPDGETGLLAIFDLANIGSAIHLLTEDLGRCEGDGFRLEGRATGAELRGCSLAAEELGG